MNTRYPIILVHGIAIKDFLFIKSFGKIDKVLSKQGYKVYKSKIDGFGTIENNAGAVSLPNESPFDMNTRSIRITTNTI